MPLKKYDKKLDYSYTYGVFPTLDLLKHKREGVIKVVLNSKGTRNGGYHELETACKKFNIPLEYDTKAVLNISVKENTYALGVFKKFETELDLNSDHVVLVNPSNTGNIGTIVRTMAGLGFKDLVLIRPAVDIFDPKVVRASMGSLFTINFKYF
ncbi:MAG: TrmH family RNA methyltransferase, partial [Candidatus Magasanikbacteria bacterium]|nr:TrmH family RNA methyltransferase [Candidatus Magasanikbacteria bacterium]